MIPILAGMIACTCFLIAGFVHQDRGERVEARKCGVMVIFSLILLFASIAVEFGG